MSPAVLENGITGGGSEQSNFGKNYIILKWNNFDSFLIKSLHELFNRNELTDVSLVCEDAVFRSHKVILAMWSPYFRDIFLNTPTKNPVIVLKDVSAKNMELLLGYLYQGEIFIQQGEVQQFLALAESLRIIGIDETLRQTAAVIPDPDLDLNEEEEDERNLLWKPERLSISSDLIALPVSPRPQITAQVIQSDPKIAERDPDPTELEQQDFQPIQAEEMLEDRGTTTALASVELQIYAGANNHAELDENSGTMQPVILPQTESQNLILTPGMNPSSKFYDRRDEFAPQNESLNDPGEFTEDLESISSIDMVYRYPEPETAVAVNKDVGTNSANLSESESLNAHDSLDFTTKKPETGKIPFLEKDVNESGPGPTKRIRLDNCSSLEVIGRPVTLARTGADLPYKNATTGYPQRLSGKGITMDLRCRICGINTYSKEAYDNHMQLHKKRGQLITTDDICQRKSFFTQNSFK